jgi:hypothetical protein
MKKWLKGEKNDENPEQETIHFNYLKEKKISTGRKFF